MRTYRYDHVHLRSPDPDATGQFFETMFGAEVTRSVYPPLQRLAFGTGRCGALDLDDHVLRRPDAWPHAPDARAHERSQTHSVPLLERETGADGRG